MRTFDAIIAGGGIIGLSLALELRKRHLTVAILDRGEPGREASFAGAGMLAASEVDDSVGLCELARFSASIYPEFVEKVEHLSGLKIDFRRQGTLLLHEVPVEGGLDTETLAQMEPALQETPFYAQHMAEDCVDPRSLIPALIAAAKAEGVYMIKGTEVRNIAAKAGRLEVETRHSSYQCQSLVNCCGAWAAELAGNPAPVEPVKGHLLSLIPPEELKLKHVLRSESVYLVPRASGMIVVGSTVERVGFDRAVNPEVIQSLFQRAANLLPVLGESRIHESWSGLRPGTPDNLPIMGAGALPGSFISTGHYRNGILLAPASARAMAAIIAGGEPEMDLSEFLPSRFSSVEKQ